MLGLLYRGGKCCGETRSRAPAWCCSREPTTEECPGWCHCCGVGGLGKGRQTLFGTSARCINRHCGVIGLGDDCVMIDATMRCCLAICELHTSRTSSLARAPSAKSHVMMTNACSSATAVRATVPQGRQYSHLTGFSRTALRTDRTGLPVSTEAFRPHVGTKWQYTKLHAYPSPFGGTSAEGQADGG